MAPEGLVPALGDRKIGVWARSRVVFARFRAEALIMSEGPGTAHPVDRVHESSGVRDRRLG
jgi:hypothetical protein